MNPAPDSKNLELFKEAYRLCKTYLLLPGVLALDDSSVKPILELGILKNTIHFRNVAEIGSNDVDSIVLQSVAYRGLPAAHSSDCRAQ
jgi:hypothetical protein